ncbi:MAG: hypothetical protein C0197_00730 [Caldimicrobium thiodismutans]|uniref:Uncharacterized protein n=1 Tax=Caldimicrobium thiodismutans TaxID=1653476 RepID=A0A2N7PL88_9BACT|nr:MAG: hypothetical protein C0197_00730 [Caldimicrobium thiodismutans]
MNKEFLLWGLLAFDVLIILLLIFLYLKVKKFLSLPWEDIEESIARAQALVEKLKELKDVKGTSDYNPADPKEEVVFWYKKGLKLKEIAKKTGLSEGEVELILKSKKLL